MAKTADNKAPISEQVYVFLSGRAGQSVSLTELARELPYTRTQIVSAVQSLRNRGVNVKTVTKGVYVFNPGAYEGTHADSHAKTQASDGHDKMLFEEVGTTRGGRLVIQDADEKLYIATEME